MHPHFPASCVFFRMSLKKRKLAPVEELLHYKVSDSYVFIFSSLAVSYRLNVVKTDIMRPQWYPVIHTIVSDHPSRRNPVPVSTIIGNACGSM